MDKGFCRSTLRCVGLLEKLHRPFTGSKSSHKAITFFQFFFKFLMITCILERILSLELSLFVAYLMTLSATQTI
jgi:hypothetical protein